MRCTAARGKQAIAGPNRASAEPRDGDPSPPVLVIGYGNIVREDDGLGCHAARRLGELLDARTARVIEAAQLMPEHAEDASRCALLILIDACRDAPPGHIHCRPIEPQDGAATGGRPITHHLDPQRLLELARALYGACPRAFVFTVGGAAFGYGESLSPAVRRSFGELIERILEAIRSLGIGDGAAQAAPCVTAGTPAASVTPSRPRRRPGRKTERSDA